MNPKTDPKSKLSLSAGPALGRRIARTRNAILLIVVVATLFFSGSVSAASPNDRCSFCNVVQHTPRPEPTVVGIPLKTPVPQRTLPPTDTAP